MTFDIDTFESHDQSMTATVCENAQLYGAIPERGEFDPRDIWDRDETIRAVGEAFRILAEGVAPDGFQLADEREHLLWGFVNCLDAQVRRLDRSVDRLAPELRDLQTAQDGSQVKSRAKYDDLVIVHGGGPGTDRLAAQWAERNGADQEVCKPDWQRHGRAAPFRRNDEMLNLLPKGLIAFEGNGITANLVDKARTLGIPVLQG